MLSEEILFLLLLLLRSSESESLLFARLLRLEFKLSFLKIIINYFSNLVIILYLLRLDLDAFDILLPAPSRIFSSSLPCRLLLFECADKGRLERSLNDGLRLLELSRDFFPFSGSSFFALKKKVTLNLSK
jgi:hypothetical protein